MIAAGAVVRAMALRQRDAELDKLASLTPSEHREVVDALGRLPRDARLDVDRLVEAYRRHVAGRRPPPDPLGPFRYFLSLCGAHELEDVRAELHRTGDVARAMDSLEGRPLASAPPAAGKRAHGGPSGAGDGSRRGIPRSRRAIRSPAPPPSTLDDALDAIEGIVAKPGRAGRAIGGRAFDASGPLGSGDDAATFPPPWLAVALEPSKETARADVA